VCVADNLWFTVLYWAAFSAFCALLSSHMTNKDDDDDDDDLFNGVLGSFVNQKFVIHTL